MPTYDFEIAAGKIEIETFREHLGLTELIDFASRDNPRRGFLFVSKVLGKYVPVAPRRLRAVFRRLGKLIGDVPGPALVVGLAETATGLGQGVFESWQGLPLYERLYMHTTRYRLAGAELACRFQETHSHAVCHYLHVPLPAFRDLFYESRTLILVDDEITTGNTLYNLASAYISLNPAVERVVFLTMVSWLEDERVQLLADKLQRPLTVGALVKGRFSFSQNPNYQADFPTGGGSAYAELYPRADLGRLGVQAAAQSDLLPAWRPSGDKPLLVLGTGEFNYLPFCLAEQLEASGFDVLFQSTARSPIRVGAGIESKLTFSDHHGEGIPNYLYNAPLDRETLILYETAEMMERHQLPSDLKVQKLAINDPDY